MSKRKIVIGMLWHSLSSNNLGVGALTLSHLKLISEVCRQLDIRPEFVLIGTKCDELLYPDIFEENIVFFETITRRKLINPTSNIHALLRKSDVVFDIGEGDSFSDLYGGNRFSKQILSKLLCAVYGVPWVLAPQTIGPYESTLNKWIAKLVMRSAKKKYCRDELSLQYCENMGLNSVEKVTDVAFALPFSNRNGFYQDGRIHIGINVSGLLYNGGYTGDNMFGLTVNYAKLMDRILKYFFERDDCQVHLVSHVAYSAESIDWKNRENDYAVSCKIKETYPDFLLEDIPSSPIEAKSLISGFEFFVGARMHACIAAASSHVPVIPLAYSRKFKGLFETIGYPYVADCCEESEDSIYYKVVDGFASREKLLNDLRAANILADQYMEKYRLGISSIISSVL